MIWAFFAILTALAVISVLHPVMRRRPAQATAAPETEFYKAQLAEIERDLARGVIGAAEADSARTEAGRRLLAAASQIEEGAAVAAPERPLAAIAILVAIPAVAVALYLSIGQPDSPDMPLAARLEQAGTDVDAALAKIEAHLQKNPDDGRGWEVVAPAYLRMRRPEDSAKAWTQAIRVLGETPERLTSRGEAIVFGASGVVTAEARASFERALQLDADMPQARYYMALAAEQDGDAQKALAIYRDMLAKAPDAPYAPLLRERMKGLGEAAPEAKPGDEGAAGAIAALPPQERQAAIRSMVENLAARLSENGHDLEGWRRLLRAWIVLGEKDRAQAALADARKALASDEQARATLEQTARDLGLEN